MRTIVTFVVFFAAGLITAATYFYNRHPQHSPIDDVPHLRRDVEGLIERGGKLHEAWRGKSGDESAPATEDPPTKEMPRDPRKGLPEKEFSTKEVPKTPGKTPPKAPKKTGGSTVSK